MQFAATLTVCPYPTDEDKDAEVRNIVNEYLFLENLSNTK